MNINFNKCVFPLYSLKKSGEVYNDGDLLGTCFLARINDFLVFITAKHIFKSFNNETNDLFIFYNNGDNIPQPLILDASVSENTFSDFAFILPMRDTFTTIIKEFLPLQVIKTVVSYGHKVYSFGFPLSTKEREIGQPLTLTINPMFFEGYIHSIWNNAPDLKFKTVYTLSFPSLQGLSGGPLISIIDGKLGVVGLMHESRMLNKVLIDQYEFKEEDSTTIEKHYLAYEMGIASNYLPFEELEILLNDIQSKFNFPKL